MICWLIICSEKTEMLYIYDLIVNQFISYTMFALLMLLNFITDKMIDFYDFNITFFES
jgi:hypothetical protein